MKKSLMMLGVAAIALASCTNDEVMNVADSRAIEFDNAFIGKATKATETTTDNLEAFQVFGGYGESYTNVFNDVIVSKSKKGDAWTYENPQYWTKDKTYTFQGYAPSLPEGVTAEPTANGVTFDNFSADGNTDLIAALGNPIIANEEFMASPTKISLTFRHVLSMISFKFTTTLANVNITISDLTVNELPNTGTYSYTSKNTGTWAVLTETKKDYTFTTEGTLTTGTPLTSTTAIVLPQTPTNIRVTFTVNATGGIEIVNAQHTVILPTTALEEGKRYIYTAELTHENIDPANPLKPIEFGKPQVNTWTDGNTNVSVDPVEPVEP